MSIPPAKHSSPPTVEPPESSDESFTSSRHVADAAVADALISAIRTCAPETPYTAERLRLAVADYVDAARARGETHGRTLSAVRHMLATLVVSPAWVGVNRGEARDIIRRFVAFASARFYAQGAYRDAQPSTAFHFELRREGAVTPVTRRGWDEEG